MKALLTALASVALVGCAVNAQPVAKRTPNGGVEHYSNEHGVKGTQENGCVLPWSAAGVATLGKNPKRLEYGEATNFYDCKIEEPKVVAAPAPKAPAPVVAAPAPAPAPVAAPAPKAPAPVVATPAPKEPPKRVTKPVRE